MVLLGAFTLSSSQALEGGEEPGGGEPIPVLAELFTSEGCSSCPPADVLLTRLTTEQPVPGVLIIGLSEHVDYWNRLGWIDRFSSPFFSRRQTEYSRVSGADRIYTPQMIVDGQREFVGSDWGLAISAIRDSARRNKARVQIEDIVLSSSGRSLDLRAIISQVPEALDGSFKVFLATFEDQLVSEVASGENQGRRLVHTGTVRRLSLESTFNTPLGELLELFPVVELEVEWNLGNLGVVVFVQDSETLAIVGAAQRRLSPITRPQNPALGSPR